MSVADHVLFIENGKLATENPRAHVDAMVGRALQDAEKGGLVLHFHGGLVPRSSGLETAARLYPRYWKDAGMWPVFFIWESGLQETLTNNLREILQEPFFKQALKRALEFVTRKLAQREGDRAAGTLPDVDTGPIEEAVTRAAEEGDAGALASLDRAIPDGLVELSHGERSALEVELDSDIALRDAIQAISNGLVDESDVASGVRSRAATVRGSTSTLMDPAALDEFVEAPSPGRRGVISTAKVTVALVRVVASVIHRFLAGRDHGFHATVVEELLRKFYLANAGGYVWKLMKDDTKDAFGADGQTAGGTALLEALANGIDADNPPRITLVGHSTGAVYISHFLDKADQVLPKSVRFDIVFLAPASTFALTAGTLRAHSHRIAGFRMFTMADDHEQKDRLVPVLYPHSLLYFVSGVVEPDADTPVVGMARFYDRSRYPGDVFGDVEAVRAFVEAEADRVAWSVTMGIPGRATQSVRHGDFDNDDTTLDSVVHVLSNRFGS